VRKVDNLTAIYPDNVGSSTSHKPIGLQASLLLLFKERKVERKKGNAKEKWNSV
jgi:hypothetical protein